MTTNKHHIIFVAVIFLLLAILLTGCGSNSNQSDITFFGKAFYDTNGNSQLDAQDSPLPGAFFIITTKSGEKYIDITDDSGEAFVGVPDGVDFPVTLTMEGPGKDKYVLIGQENIVLDKATSEIQKFLFKAK